MADIKKPAGSDAVAELKWFIGILIILGFLWLLSGGPKKETPPEPFIQSPTENINIPTE